MILLEQFLQHLLEPCPVQSQVSLKWTKKNLIGYNRSQPACVVLSPSNNPPLGDCSGWAPGSGEDCAMLPGVRCPTSPSNNPSLVGDLVGEDCAVVS
ncbi:hypothetical protein CEXT_63621 [Caerostris extrusa]|uniref:Uncharacterized protein n=1 Tax=Caerostris extrusa TaxID=172846 RepID=A0AAV4MDS4_CAEEX|nr:hypothetical protein CEXT_63621 [Caerostris extrusa]